VKKTYHIVNRDAQSASKSIQEFAQANGQILLPLVELITQARVAVDNVIQSIGPQTIETILTLSAAFCRDKQKRPRPRHSEF